MIRKLMMLGLLVSFLSVGTLAAAEEVVVTGKGHKYHTELCGFVKNKEAAITMEKEQAVEEGYEPCKRCFKEDVGESEKIEEKK